MTRRISYDLRRTQDGLDGSVFEIGLVEITHPELATPIRACTAPCEVITRTPYVLGCRSDWQGADPESDYWQFLPMTLEPPGDSEQDSQSVQLTLMHGGAALVDLVRSYVSPRPVLNVAIVSSADPSTVEAEWLGMQIIDTSYSADGVTVEASYAFVDDEPAQMHIMTLDRVPGLEAL
ncbi:hypothetical protein Q4543_17575 [Salipiger sp. 1_MG-2023]|uniref:hypothetical protein n=1 Tax=Salipiger sp. 1_MG-2023 TaxID=3062665 RepID=UPI0026E30505|nr:hypothetical protein [Salipiger sp. 1_MG-2023]MDO6587325.1 hypothetical protein [Salipiger sp. 1_MG-2023]